ncbi:MAG TPA: dipeptidase [Bryobacteraceae bacterium]|jgi:membrane dipeptidase|nr:dipeptidase [Bryobacteraceae bacterium]
MAKLLHSIPALAASLMLAAPPTNSKMSPRLFSGAKTQQSAIDAEVQKITKSAILIDTHNDIPSFTVDGADIGTSTSTMTNIARLRQGGVGAVFFSVYVASKYVDGNHSAHRALEMIDTVRHDIIDRYPDTFQFALTADDIVRAHKHHKIAALMGLEGGHAIEDSPRLLRDYYRLGIRYMTLTHTNTNNWADSSGDINKPDVQHHNGLTPQGKDFIREMNRLGMMVDISHVADKTFYDALEVSQAPLIASHSATRALTDVPRNMTDDMIRALAKKGGVIQINFYCNFVARPGEPHATLADVVAHMDHVRQIAGIDAIGLGTDFDGIDCAPTGLEDVSKFPALTRALLEKGYSVADIKKIYGENTLRLMRQVERTAASMKQSAK